MKTFFIKILLFVCAVVAIAEGMFFFLVAFKRIYPQDIISFYALVLQTPKYLNVTLGFSAGFLLLGFVLLAVVFRGSRTQKAILIKDKGETLRIPIDAVSDFANQLLHQNPYISDYDTAINSKGKWLYVDISFVSNDAFPINQGVSEIRAMLRDELTRVFAFDHLRINFQMKNISINSDKPRLMDKEQIEEEKISVEHLLTDKVDIVPNDEEIIEKDSSKDKKDYKKMPWSLFNT